MPRNYKRAQTKEAWRQLLVAVAERVEEFGAETVAECKRSWRQKYGSPKLPEPFLWHCFSFQQHPHLAGGEAEVAYQNRRFKAYVVFFEHADWGFLCRGGELPPVSHLRHLAGSQAPETRDVYLAQHELAWTFCLTHEADFGPYFAAISK